MLLFFEEIGVIDEEIGFWRSRHGQLGVGNLGIGCWESRNCVLEEVYLYLKKMKELGIKDLKIEEIIGDLTFIYG